MILSIHQIREVAHDSPSEVNVLLGCLIFLTAIYLILVAIVYFSSKDASVLDIISGEYSEGLGVFGFFIAGIYIIIILFYGGYLIAHLL